MNFNPRMVVYHGGIVRNDVRPCEPTCRAYACEDLREEIAERVMEGGLHLVVLCRYGDRKLPTSAAVIWYGWTTRGGLGVAQDVDSPIPVSYRGDVLWPYDPRPLDYGVHS